MPLTKRNAHELRLPQMPDAPLSPTQLAMMMMMMVMTMAMGNAAMSASAFAFYSTARERKNNEHLVRRKGVLWIWLGKSSVRLPACLTVRIVVVVVSTARLCYGCAHEKFIHSVEFRA